jgi:pimeloyl-ACP methyl ester carboxylesterase
MRKWVKRVVLTFLGVYLIFAAGLYLFQESLLFLPSHLDREYEYWFANAAEEINLENEGVTLNALHFKVKNSKGVILYFHGNAGDLSRWGEIIQPLLKFNRDIVIMDYRGYGKNGGEFSEVAIHSDAQAFYDYTKEEFEEDEIILYGRSLGSTFATYIASNNNPSKLILETPFYSIKSVAKRRFPFLPIDWLLKYHFETYKMVPKVDCPTLILLSENDAVVGFESGLKLSEEFTRATTISIKNAGHNNQAQYDLYWKSIEEFLAN